MGTATSTTAMDIQHEKAFQKQDGIFLNKKKRSITKKESIRATRFYKNVGLGFKTPRTAIENNYVDKKCPFTGNVSIRGRILTGKVASVGKMNRTITVRRDYLHYITKYQRYEKRHKMISVHCSPCFRLNMGDLITFGQNRPISKTVRFNVLRVDRRATRTKGGKQF